MACVCWGKNSTLSLTQSGNKNKSLSGIILLAASSAGSSNRMCLARYLVQTFTVHVNVFSFDHSCCMLLCRKKGKDSKDSKDSKDRPKGAFPPKHAAVVLQKHPDQLHQPLTVQIGKVLSQNVTSPGERYMNHVVTEV